MCEYVKTHAYIHQRRRQSNDIHQHDNGSRKLRVYAVPYFCIVKAKIKFKKKYYTNTFYVIAIVLSRSVRNSKIH